MKNKKLAALLLAGVVAVSGASLLAACGGNNTQGDNSSQQGSSNSNTGNKITAQNVGDEIYRLLNKSYNAVDRILDDEKHAWYQYIYENYKLSDTFLLGYHLSDKEFVAGAKKLFDSLNLYGSSAPDDYLAHWAKNKSATYVILSVVTAYKENGVYASIDEDITTVKDDIKKLMTDYPDYQYTQSLNSMYTAFKQMYDFSASPSGSYATFDSTVNGYKNSYNTTKTSISIIFE